MVDETLLEEFEQALLSLDRLAVKNLLTKFSSSESPIELIEKLVVPALNHIGFEWEAGRVALSQVYMSGRLCEEFVKTILPHADFKRKDQPNMAIAVLEDYHLLGKRVVYSVLRASGFELLDYGRVTVDEVVSRVKADQIDILLISVLMLPSALRIKDLKAKLNQQGIAVKLIVGGAPFRFDANLWKEVGADAMGKNASEAINIITHFMESQT
ncbi:MAG: cobalamin-binding protein [Candidatus Parabeggiatoa sp. nov. 3]|nr:MAG: cobalamin-binding protein [Gammaproteobacteria bacterium]RKZ58581.1 MAG: cobalamin-binding protein [Gammaproteobacteria bacterium]RKZ79126.1 MAG: cobalamin-binding protein [Gammaproteobacteria bacterium]